MLVVVICFHILMFIKLQEKGIYALQTQYYSIYTELLYRD
jgi:hypothetical protein